jgi:hypothetical protein
VPADHIDARYACDFCSDERIVYTFRTSLPIQTLLVAGSNELVQNYGTDWSARIDCADLVQARDLDGLHARIIGLGRPFDQQVADQLHTMLGAVLDRLLPGRALAAIGRWPPAPLPAATLPRSATGSPSSSAAPRSCPSTSTALTPGRSSPRAWTPHGSTGSTTNSPTLSGTPPPRCRAHRSQPPRRPPHTGCSPGPNPSAATPT